jgi:hypothetical protein
MSDEVKASFRQSLITVGAIGIVGTLLGGAFGAFWSARHAAPQGHEGHRRMTMDGKAEAGKHSTVRIVLKDNNGKCTQQVEGVRFAYPVLRPQTDSYDGDSVEWQGVEGRPSTSPLPRPTKLAIVVEFDKNASPFADFHFESITAPGPTGSSGTPIGTASDYDYASVVIGGVKCVNWDPGVHVTP